ncbi:motility associated factor glycosyltransferase family protein [Pseudoalteromonas sp. NZS71_1]|uniref:motility associated factor glycosyltransferase family protein n=1 Tax=Pseudoalteromonas sp. NZS71_1 TaxID=2792072 RepID=UPI0018CEC4F0|nr:6-hydroxymethylpterin diphosphokinase MptE-like protein [Pseudoalteromonas sp. NZS71_1]MBH0033759.1 motility associated factor glycosyltransferase family protein [Pseudoalteromonas sp. NZS71_1]
MNTVESELKKMMLKATLLANLELLKEKMPQIFDMFKDFQPTDTGVVIDDEGNENLYSNGRFSYTENPREFAKKQVSKFLKSPVYSHYRIKHSNDENIVFKHAALLKSINNVRLEHGGEKLDNPANEQQLDFVCFLGAGLGYHIKELLNKKNVLNVFLYEQTPSTFYALLHCIELRPLFNKCLNNGGVFRIQVGGTKHDVVNEIGSMLSMQGFFNTSVIHYFKHYNSDSIDEAIKKIKEVGHRWHGGWGFFEDEIIGVSHTIANLTAQFPVIKKAGSFKNKLKDTPVFIVANGPSLDLAIDFLKENQKNIIIISCGTALKALLVNNIKPDIHVEMERTAQLLEWVEVVERTREVDIKLSDLNIVALNTVFDQILKRFKSAFLLNKLNDAGGRLIEYLDRKKQYACPMFTNPTVSNAALAIAAELGFKTIYLIGTDFGFVSTDTHHAKDSIYYDKDFKYKEQTKDMMQGEIRVKGNFREEVYSTSHFDMSKFNMELLLKHQPKLKVYNTTDGAYIKLAEPKRMSDIKIKNAFVDKHKKIKQLLDSASSLDGLSEKNINTASFELKHKSKHILEQLIGITSFYFETREQLADAFYRQNQLLINTHNNNEDVYWLIQGTFRYFQTYIMANTYYFNDLDSRAEFINVCIDAFHNHLNDIYIEFSENYNKPAKV